MYDGKYAENTDARLVKAAALRARGYRELNPIARSWYRNGALELEGAIDTDQVAAAMMQMVTSDASVAETIAGWRYTVDADAAGTSRITVGLRVTDTGDEVTLRLRNSILIVDDGIADDVDAVVELSSAQVTADPGAAKTVEGDPDAFATLFGFLDLEVSGFKMHQR